MRKFQMLLVAAGVAAISAFPIAPASATHNCGGGAADIVCEAQHFLLDKVNWYIECKVLHNC
jgi:hypothetical protein